MPGPEDEIIKVGLAKLPSVLSYFWAAGRQFATERDLFHHITRYKEWIEQDYSFMQILGMERAVPVDEIYTEIKILNRVSSRNFRTVADLTDEARRVTEEQSFAKVRADVKKRLEKEIRRRTLKPVEAKVADWYQLAHAQLLSEIENSDGGERDALKLQLRHLRKERHQKIIEARKAVQRRQLTEDELLELEQRLASEVEKAIKSAVHVQLSQVEARTAGHIAQKPAWEAVHDKDRVILLGKPGAGKTTVLKHFLLRQLRAEEMDPKVPVFISMKEFADSGSADLIDFISATFEQCGFDSASLFVDRLLIVADRLRTTAREHAAG